MRRSTYLVGDIGGTNARFAIAQSVGDQIHLENPQSFICSQFETAELAIDHYLAGANVARPNSCVLAVAGAVTNGAVTSTNGEWRISEAALSGQGFDHAHLINDFTAQALSIGALQEADFARVGDADILDRSLPAVVLGAGTGFGAAILADGPVGHTIVSTESGHAAFAPTDAIGVELWRLFSQWYGRVSIERILSGQGLADLYRALGQIHGHQAHPLEPREILERSTSGLDPLSRLAVDQFVAAYGSVAGDIALTTGARGGVYIAGGIAPRILSNLQSAAFQQRFTAKGRFTSYLAAIPIRVVTHPFAALVGAARVKRA